MDLNKRAEIYDLLFESLPFLFWKDIKGRYCGSNLNQAKAFGLDSPDDLIGKTIFELLEDQDSAKLIDDNDNKIMKEKKPVVLEEEIITPYGKKVYLSTKQPIFNDAQKVIGLLGTAIEITQLAEDREIRQKLEIEQQKLALQKEVDIHKAIIVEHNKFNSFIDEIQRNIKAYQLELLNEKTSGTNTVNSYEKFDIKLTTRDVEILYLLSIGKSPKEIASILSKIYKRNISASTISALINKQLYPKFDVYNVSQLIEKATSLKMIPFMAESILAAGGMDLEGLPS